MKGDIDSGRVEKKVIELAPTAVGFGGLGVYRLSTLLLLHSGPCTII